MKAEYVTKLPADKHSVWGIGRTQPDPEQARAVGDVTVPLGKPTTHDNNAYLLYNEYPFLLYKREKKLFSIVRIMCEGVVAG